MNYRSATSHNFYNIGMSQNQTGVTWRFKVLYERHLELTMEELLQADDNSGNAIADSYKTIKRYKSYRPSLLVSTSSNSEVSDFTNATSNSSMSTGHYSNQFTQLSSNTNVNNVKKLIAHKPSKNEIMDDLLPTA